ncbi:MAG: plasmid pRiA4b ORF-3 family protein, partial [Bradymonadaceae bacterium]
MKKIKQRRRDRSLEWHVFILEAPREIDPVGLATLLLVMDPSKGEFADFLPLPQPVEVPDVVDAVETLYRHLPLARRPAKITVMAKKYVEPLASSPILDSATIVGDRNPELENEMLQFLKKMPDKLSDGVALGIEPRREDFIALSKRLYATKAWLHLFDEEVLILDVPDRPLSHPVVSVMGLMGQLRGFAFFRSEDDFEDFIERGEMGMPGMDELDQLLFILDDAEEVGEVGSTSYRRRGWEAGPGFFPHISLHATGRETPFITDATEADAALRHLEVLVPCIEDVVSRGFPPYPEWPAELTVDGETVNFDVLDRSVEQYEHDLENLSDLEATGPAKKILRIRVELDDVKPPIYRTFEVPDFLTMAGLHDVVQRTMGWENRHLWTFHYKGKDYTLPSDEHEGAFEEIDATTETIQDVLGSRAKNFTYIYDYADDWRHSLRVEARTAPEKDVTYPRLIDGARACPPEDVGGAPGYEHMLEELQSPAPTQELLEWLGDFDPERFDPTRVELPEALILNRIWLYEEAMPGIAEAFIPEAVERL